MAFRWDLLKPTKELWQRDRMPTVDDATTWYPVIWVYTSANLAWRLKDGTIQILPPTSGNVVVVAGVTPTEFNALESKVSNLEVDMNNYVATVLDNVITSDPGTTEYKVKKLALDSNKKIIVTHDDTPET